MRARPHAALQFLLIAVAFAIAPGLAACGGGGSTPAPVVITAQPTDQSVVAGTTATFQVTASGATGYQWQRSTDGGATFSDLSTTSATLALAVVPLGDDGHRFRAVVSNGGGSVTSNAALLTVTAQPALLITTTSPLPSGTVNTPYSVQLAASGGTPPFTWSTTSGGPLPANLALDAATGLISGTPTAAAAYALNFRVSDSASPQQSDTRSFDLNIDAQCDIGLGSATIAGAPNTVEGRFCAQTAAAPGAPGTLGWAETYPYGAGSYRENVTVRYDSVTGLVNEVSFYLNDPTRSILWYCASGVSGPPPCTGVTIDGGLRTVYFINTVLGENGTANNPLTLNGVLIYP